MPKNSTYDGVNTWESGCELLEIVHGQVGAVEGIPDHQVGEVHNLHLVHRVDADHHIDTPYQQDVGR